MKTHSILSCFASFCILDLSKKCWPSFHPFEPLLLPSPSSLSFFLCLLHFYIHSLSARNPVYPFQSCFLLFHAFFHPSHLLLCLLRPFYRRLNQLRQFDSYLCIFLCLHLLLLLFHPSKSRLNRPSRFSTPNLLFL